MKKRIHNYITILLLLFFSAIHAQKTNYSSYVNPFIGTGGHGHTFPGATVPFGMVQLSPDTRIDGSWDGCSGYHHSDSIIYGFSHTHLSGTGCSDYGDIVLLPLTKTITSADLKDRKLFSTFSHKNEIATAGYYAVNLDNGVKAELTATTRIGFHKYTFPKSEFSYIVLDLELRDKVIIASASATDRTKIAGYRQYEAWAKNQIVFYDLEFSEPFIEATTQFGALDLEEPFSGTKIRIAFKFKTPANNTIMAKVALSPVSDEGAQKNMDAECTHWDFNKVKKEAEELWNRELSKIEVTSADNDKLTIFYTALYHTMIQPNVAMDVDGMYRGRDNKIHKAEGFTYYSVFSLWDTFRATHPLYTLIDRKRTQDFVYTFLEQYKQGGRLPVWEVASNETDCMIGYHSVSVIADAATKGILNYDPKLTYNMNLAFEAMKHSAMLDHLGLKAVKNHAVITMDDEHESVSKTLEYAYDDWCIAQVASQLSKTSEYNYFMQRSQTWKNIFDPETGFMRPKKNGGWLSPFDPREVNNNFTEANSWQYTFFVPHDAYGLVEHMGGAAKFDAKLDELFTTSSQTTGREQADITGLVGQYAHGNEPSHHIAYLYNYIGKPWKTQERVYQLMNDFYKNAPDGLIGNEDCGQMSAWYVMSAMGLYQVCPGSPQFNIGTPLFSDVKIHLENGNAFVVRATNISEKNKFIQSAKINKMPIKENRINYTDIFSPTNTKGNSELVFEMTATPNTTPDPNLFIADPSYFHNYENGVHDNELAISPVIKADSKVFEDSLKIELIGYERNSKIYYIIEDISSQLPESIFSTSGRNIIEYTKPFYINKNATISAYCIKKITEINSKQSAKNVAHFYKRPNNWDIKILSKYNPQYTAGGDKGIIDGVHGETNWRKGEWQGYQSQNFECIIDLKKEQTVSTFTSSYLQDTRAWIVMPTKVEYYTSADNVNFKLAGSISNKIEAKDYEVQMQNLELKAEPTKARYIKIKAYNYGKLPEWHQGAGGDAFIFIDEINIK